MDLYCRHCREPWDNDSLHEEVAERKLLDPSDTSTYDQVAAQFRRFGCGALFAFMGTATEPRVCPNKQSLSDFDHAVIEAAYELGDDMDGAASFMADYL